MKEVIVEDYVSSGEDVEQGIGEEDESTPSDGQISYDELDKGNIENVKAPAIAVDYWRLPADATLRDVVMVVREDEAHHRDVNHFASCPSKKQSQPTVSLKYPEFVHFKTRGIIKGTDKGTWDDFWYVVIKDGGNGCLIPGVHYAPEVTLNILSIDILKQQGFDIISEGDRWTLEYMFKKQKGQNMDIDKMRQRHNDYLDDYFESLDKERTDRKEQEPRIVEDTNALEELPGSIPPVIQGVTIHLFDLYKLMDSMGGYLSVHFGLEFGALAEILGLTRSDGEEIRKCYMTYLEAFRGASSAEGKGKEKLEQFGIKVEEEEDCKIQQTAHYGGKGSQTTCYKCQDTEHYAFEYPEKNKRKGRSEDKLIVIVLDWPCSAFSISTIIKATRVVVKSSGDDVSISRGSGTTARGRRFLKVREEKRKREFDRLHNYPSWAKYLLLTCNNVELRNILGDTIGNPDQMRLKVEDRIRKKGRDFHKPKTGCVVAFKVIQSWYLMGRLGAYNSSNLPWPFILQLANTSMEYNPLYDADKGFNVMPSSFHDVGDVEFQDNWGQVYQCGHPAAPAKVVQYQQDFPQGNALGYKPRDRDMESSATREYPSLIHTFFVTHTVNGVFTRDEDRAIYEEMLRLQALGSNTPSGVPYTDEEINALARKGKQRGHLPGVGRVLPGRATDVLIPPPPPPPQCTHNSGDVKKLKKKNKYLTKQVNLMMKLFNSDEKFSQMLNHYESTPEFGSGSGGCGDDEMADDEDGGEDEEDGDS
ncbi:ARID DNA-binding domain-containing protein [Tanacetum coccineum]